MYKHHSLLIIPAIIFVFDRLLKYIVYTLPLGEVFSFPGFKFGYFLNPTLFFLPAWHFIQWVALAVLLSIFIFWIWTFVGNWKLDIENSQCQAILFILLGGSSNVYDRFMHGGVIDVVNIFGLATINLADLLITAGIVGFLLNNQNQKPNNPIT